MKLYNAEIVLLLPVVRREAKENPNREWDRLLERLEKIARFRAYQLKEHVTPDETPARTTARTPHPGKETTDTQDRTPSRDHPLLANPKQHTTR